MKCPNISHEDWKVLESKYGYATAMKAYVLNNEEIPTVEEADKLLGNKISYQKFNDIVQDLKHRFNVTGIKYSTVKDATVRAKGINDYINRQDTPVGYRAIASKNTNGNNIVTFVPTKDNRSYQQRIDYNLKLTDALTKLQRNAFDITKVQGWLNDLQKQGIPKEQLDMFKNAAKDGMTKDEILASILANFSYSVEVNTAKEVRSSNYEDSLHRDVISKGGYEYTKDSLWKTEMYGEGNKEQITQEEYDSVFNDTTPTQYYSNLTVPGGTNYTENEISTPLITPSIKGHAQFSTDNGIGWFRSDEQRRITREENEKFNKQEIAELDRQLRNRVITVEKYESELSNLAKRFKKATDEGSKTRRILELQSDLFQKGRDNKDLITKVSYAGDDRFVDDLGNINTEAKWNAYYKWIEGTKYEPNTPESFKAFDEQYLNKSISNADNQFLQLLNKDNNWVTFFIKSIIQDSAKKGYEKVLFPKGETAAKVEGHQTIADEIESINSQIDELSKKESIDAYSTISAGSIFQPSGQYNDDYNEELRNKKEQYKDKYIVVDRSIGEDGRIYGVNLPQTLNGIKLYSSEVEAKEEAKKKGTYNDKRIKELEQKKSELKSQGIEKLKPIEAFYEIKVGNILKKQYSVKEITDEYGNGWLEVDMSNEKNSNQRILLQQNSEQLPENRQDFEEKKKILQKEMPNVDVIEDNTLSVLGEARTINGKKTVIINPDLMTSDTVGHEFGHMLIDIIGGVESPLARRGLQLLKGTTIEKEVRELYADKDEKILKHEMLARAIGEDFAKLFKEEQKRNSFESWLARIFERLRQLLGIEKSGIRNLTRMLFDGPKETGEVPNFESSTYESRKSVLLTDEKLVKQAVDIILRKKALYEHTGYRTAVEKMDQLLLEMATKDKRESLMKFTSYADKQTTDIFARYERERLKEQKGLPAFDVAMLKQWNEYLSAFEILDSIRDYAAMDTSIILTPEYRIKLNEIISKRDQLRNLYKNIGYSKLIDTFMPFVTRAEGEVRRDAEREYNLLPKEERSKISLNEYLNKAVEKQGENIEEKTRVLLETEALKAKHDINQIYRWADNLLDSNDTLVAAAVKMLVYKDEEARLKGLTAKGKIVDALRELETVIVHNMAKKEESFYDFMLEKDRDGELTGYLISEYSSRLMKDYREMVDVANEMEDEDLKVQHIKKWYKENAPIKYDQLRNNLLKYYQSLQIEGHLTESDISTLMYKFDAPRHNPIVNKSLSDLVGMEKADIIDEGMSDVLWKSRDINEKYKNSKWKEFDNLRKKNPLDPRVKFYNLVTKLSDEADNNLPTKYKLNFHDLMYRIPSIAKDSRERAKSEGIKGYFKGTGHALVKRDEDIEKGQRELVGENNEPIDFIPIFYTQPMPVSDRSFDLATAYYKFYDMAAHYEAKSEVLPQMELARYFINNREVTRTDSKGRPLKNAIKSLADRELTKNGQTSLIAAQFEDWFKAIMYGQTQVDEGDLNIFGLKVDKAKAMGLLGRYSAFNLLALNTIQGVNNVLVGETMQAIEAFAGQHMSKASYTKANLFFAKNYFAFLGDIGSRKPNGILAVLNEEFTITNEGTEPLRRSTKFRSLMTMNSLFFLQHGGEFEMQVKFVIGMLNEIKAKDSSGKELGPMLDFLSVKHGELHVDEKVTNFNEKQRIEFGQKAKRILSTMHGEYSYYGKVALERYGIGKMTLAFRKFIIPGFKRRWAKEAYNEFSQTFTEGNYVTTIKFIKQLRKDINIFKLSLITQDWQKLTRVEKANIYRTVTELAFMSAAIILSTIFMAKKKEFEGDNDKEWSFAAYEAARYLSELQFFINPLAAMSILRSPMASMSVVENSARLLNQMLHPTARYIAGPWKDELKLKKDAINMIVGLRQYYRLRDIEQQLAYFNNSLY